MVLSPIQDQITYHEIGLPSSSAQRIRKPQWIGISSEENSMI